MTKPAFIVEGFQEQKIVYELCPGCRTLRLNTNGRLVKLEKIAKMIQDNLISFGNRYHPIVVVFDREGRVESSQAIIEGVRKNLEKFQRREFIDKMIFGVPDRKLEAWLLPFIDKSGNFVDKPTEGHEGFSCLGELENRMLEASEVGYNKTDNGVTIFKKIDPMKLSTVSASFQSFLTETELNGLNCRWLKKI